MKLNIITNDALPPNTFMLVSPASKPRQASAVVAYNGREIIGPHVFVVDSAFVANDENRAANEVVFRYKFWVAKDKSNR